LHGSTFGGNPLACAAALAVLRVMERDQLPQKAAEQGASLMTCLRQIQSPLVREVRGLGLMIGIELKKKVAPYLQAMSDRGVLALPAGMTVIRLLPPLVITSPQVERVVEVIDEVLAQSE
jgi:acetylornithine/LysW-gamma-L-lysine aminotransferase